MRENQKAGWQSCSRSLTKRPPDSCPSPTNQIIKILGKSFWQSSIHGADDPNQGFRQTYRTINQKTKRVFYIGMIQKHCPVQLSIGSANINGLLALPKKCTLHKTNEDGISAQTQSENWYKVYLGMQLRTEETSDWLKSQETDEEYGMFSRCAARNQNIHQKDSNLHQQLH
jgi:hypothetical protein